LEYWSTPRESQTALLERFRGTDSEDPWWLSTGVADWIWSLQLGLLGFLVGTEHSGESEVVLSTDHAHLLNAPRANPQNPQDGVELARHLTHSAKRDWLRIHVTVGW